LNAFKIELFRKENPQLSFPYFDTLDDENTAIIRRRISQKLKVNEILTGKAILNLLTNKAVLIKNYNASTSGFMMSDVFNYLNIVPKEKIYINWYQYDDIDIMDFKDFDKYFDDIWFPISDDIEVFDDTLGWVLAINHDGYIRWNKL
jgi:hypothetical protein